MADVDVVSAFKSDNRDVELSPEEKKFLKEIIQNAMAGNRTLGLIRRVLIFVASSVGAGLLIWEFILKK